MDELKQDNSSEVIPATEPIMYVSIISDYFGKHADLPYLKSIIAMEPAKKPLIPQLQPLITNALTLLREQA